MAQETAGCVISALGGDGGHPSIDHTHTVHTPHTTHAVQTPRAQTPEFLTQRVKNVSDCVELEA